MSSQSVEPGSVSPPSTLSPHSASRASDRDGRSLSPNPAKKRRTSHFKEIGVDVIPRPSGRAKRPSRRVRFQSKSSVFEAPAFDCLESPDEGGRRHGAKTTPDYSVPLKEPVEPSLQRLQSRRSSPAKLIALTVFFAALLTLLHNTPLIGSAGTTRIGVKGGVVKGRDGYVGEEAIEQRELVERQQQYDPLNYCKRWSHQSAMVNGTIYIYGGRMTTQSGQTDNTWNNGFLTLDATKTWQIVTPAYNALPQPSGPPAVANGYLWHSYTSLFLYGGEYSDHPATSPSPFALWEYDIPSKTWNEHSSPTTSPGNNTDSNAGGQQVQNAAEGAGISIPSLGRGYFFGGHLDVWTTVGWSLSTYRAYLKSLLEFTFPGFMNNGVQSLASTPAGSDGAFRNVTNGGNQGEHGFSERADGVLVYIPGFGQEGVILGLAGGNNVSFQDMNIIDVYDIADSQWYQQSTNGSYPKMRVNPCAVAASAPDGSSTNVYMFGGQNLEATPENQTQYNDLWILSVPSFNWIEVDLSGQSTPPGRSGHSCEIWDGQMIVIGGYVGQDISCESPGVYVFDMSNLKWQNQFSSLSGGDPENQQSAQSNDPNALSGSYGYQVPAAVQSVIGGASTGGATQTVPIATATAGPLATGTPVIYTVTGTDGATVTETAPPGTVVTTGSNSGPSGPNIAAIVAGTIAGVLFILACYLAFCTYVYRKQLQLYKNHVAAAQRAAAAPINEKPGFLGANLGRNSDDPSSGRMSTDVSSGPSSSRAAASSRRGNGAPPVPALPGAGRVESERQSNAGDSTDDLLVGQEPSFMGVLLSPRRSLRVINRD